MHCNICHRSPSTGLPHHCTVCARDCLYKSRVNLARALLEQEAARNQVDQSLNVSRARASKPSVVDQSTAKDDSAPFAFESISVDESAVKEQTSLILDHSDHLRVEVGKVKEEIASRRASNTKRKEELARARQELAHHAAADLGSAQKAIGRIQHRWDTLHSRTAESRLLLSEVNSVSATLAHLVHLLSHYLSLRLPAEITLPHRDYPLPTILPPSSSYLVHQIPFPITNPVPSSQSSPSVSRALSRGQKPRPQPLYLKTKLSLLAKADPHAYRVYVEGMTLLAWNVAWLCKSQGIDVGATSWEDVCDLGKNLWRLSTAERRGAAIASDAQSRPTQQGREADLRRPTLARPRDIQQTAVTSPHILLGQHSHETVHSNLASATGSEHMRGWRLQDPATVVERVKQMLQSDRTGAGWEILEGNEWETQPMTADSTGPASVVDASTVVVSSDNASNNLRQTPSSKLAVPAAENEQDPAEYTSGWTKLKSR
ncbi:MAG: hypothetical protein Q9201_003177 [Fulgogasparrea decipioides]